MLTKKLFSYFSTETYIVGTQKNRLNETDLLITQNMLNIDGPEHLCLKNLLTCFLTYELHEVKHYEP